MIVSVNLTVMLVAIAPMPKDWLGKRKPCEEEVGKHGNRNTYGKRESYRSVPRL